jgi:alpha-ketoglutarate-dependent taurine dioxygenase
VGNAPSARQDERVISSSVHPWYRVVSVERSGTVETLRAVVRDAFASGVRALRIVDAASGPDPLSFWHDVGGAIGSSVPIGDDAAVRTVRHRDRDWMDVRFDPGRQDTFRHARTAQPLHTDGAHVRQAPGFALMVMAKQSGSGGASVLLDAATIARVASSEDPALFADLTTLPVNMALPPARGSHAPILARTDSGWYARWNYYRVVPGQGERVAAFCERFRTFLATLAASEHAEVFRLEDGDALLLDDGAVLHGRQAFAASEDGDRLMWKTYFAR